MSIKVLVVDDEAAARERLRELIEGNDALAWMGEACNGIEALEKIDELKPQLVFLDIQMPVLTGFDVLSQIAQEDMPAVIFATAFDQYAIQAFEVAAVDYLLKPFSAARFQQAVDRLVATQGHQSLQVETLLNEVPVSYVQQIAVRQHKRIHLMAVTEISRIVSEHRLIQVYDREHGRYWTNDTLAQLEKRLDPAQFFRIHRSSLINLEASFELEPWQDGRLKLHFSDGVTLVAAREPARELRNRLGV